jgi:hypothetical protein
VSNGGLSVSFSDGSITPEVVDLPVELVFWISVNESSVRRLFSSSVSVEDASGEFRASNPLVLSLTAPRSRPWIEKVLERYGQTRSAMLNVTEFASCYAETFPLLGGVAVVESGQDEHGHNHGRVGENISIPSYCHPANEIFEQSDANRDAFLSSEELVFTMAVFLQMTADGCHALTARVVVPACSFVRSSFAEAWGYAFLSAVLMSLISVVFGVVSMFTKVCFSCAKFSVDSFLLLFQVSFGFAQGASFVWIGWRICDVHNRPICFHHTLSVVSRCLWSGRSWV